jgi:hypothetical protein
MKMENQWTQRSNFEIQDSLSTRQLVPQELGVAASGSDNYFGHMDQYYMDMFTLTFVQTIKFVL